MVLIMCLHLKFTAIHIGGMINLRHVTSMDVCERWKFPNRVVREVAVVNESNMLNINNMTCLELHPT